MSRKNIIESSSFRKRKQLTDNTPHSPIVHLGLCDHFTVLMPETSKLGRLSSSQFGVSGQGDQLVKANFHSSNSIAKRPLLGQMMVSFRQESLSTLLFLEDINNVIDIVS